MPISTFKHCWTSILERSTRPLRYPAVTLGIFGQMLVLIDRCVGYGIRTAVRSFVTMLRGVWNVCYYYYYYYLTLGRYIPLYIIIIIIKLCQNPGNWAKNTASAWGEECCARPLVLIDSSLFWFPSCLTDGPMTSSLVDRPRRIAIDVVQPFIVQRQL